MVLGHTRPALSSRIRLQSMIVFSLCAMMSIVQDWNSCLIVFCIRASVLTSTAAVASSRTRTFDLRSNALARLSSCLCPTLKLSPPSETFIQCKRLPCHISSLQLIIQKSSVGKTNHIKVLIKLYHNRCTYLSI